MKTMKMMKAIGISLVVLTLVSLAGCGDSVCDEGERLDWDWGSPSCVPDRY
ncbi:MAG: hypothetical protein ACR2PJ_03630 [Pseudomonadales bacterium]